MAKCETCGNDYDRTFTVIMANDKHVFDSFECAISALAPACSRCHIRIIGHGVEAYGQIYCCANCARGEGIDRVKDHVA
jgi:hypothetical protein